MNEQNISKVYVTLFDEGTPTIRETNAISMGNENFKLLPTPNYDPEDETWEFLPGSIVKVSTIQTDNGEYVLLATEQIVD